MEAIASVKWQQLPASTRRGVGWAVTGYAVCAGIFVLALQFAAVEAACAAAALAGAPLWVASLWVEQDATAVRRDLGSDPRPSVAWFSSLVGLVPLFLASAALMALRAMSLAGPLADLIAAR